MFPICHTPGRVLCSSISSWWQYQQASCSMQSRTPVLTSLNLCTHQGGKRNSHWGRAAGATVSSLPSKLPLLLSLLWPPAHFPPLSVSGQAIPPPRPHPQASQERRRWKCLVKYFPICILLPHSPQPLLVSEPIFSPGI